MDDVLFIADRGEDHFEIVEGVGEAYYVFRWAAGLSTHDYLQPTVEAAKETALECRQVPLDAWRQPDSGERTLFERDSEA